MSDAKKDNGPTILAPKGGELQFEVVTSHWSQLLKGEIRTEKELGGPDNVARLIDAGCIVPATA